MTATTNQISGLKVLYQDEAVIVLDKPAGMLSVPGRGPDKQDSLAQRVQHMFVDAKVVHRLDCHTSGVMLMARGLEAQRELSRQFHDRETEKQYLAIVHGVFVQDEAVIDLAMRGDPENRPVQILDQNQGKQAITRWIVLERYENTTRLQLLPITGRTHQLRLHCSSIGHTIVGDRLYGGDHDRLEPRMLLHAHSLAFKHPQTNQRIIVRADCEF